MTDVFSAPHAPAEQTLIMKVASVVRYRFFLYAGLLPYLLGAGWAYGVEKTFRPGVFWLGLLGIFLSVVGVESFNEYFDAKMGTDRVFNPDAEEYIPEWMFSLGVAAFAVAAAIGFYLAWQGGWPIVLYTLLGGAAAVWYVGPPVRWVYRGLGETVIGLSYGPWMVSGSVQLHTHRFSWGALLASLVPGLLIMGLATVNNIPDFHQDRLVGKKNLVVRLGRKNGRYLYSGPVRAGTAGHGGRGRHGSFPEGRGISGRGRDTVVVFEPQGRQGYLGHSPIVRARGDAHRSMLRAHDGGLRLGGGLRGIKMRIDSFAAPTMVTWQLTRDCNLACLHCCTDSAPGKALPHELSRERALSLCREIIDAGVPYAMIVGGEPTLVPHFAEVCRTLSEGECSSRSRATGVPSTSPR